MIAEQETKTRISLLPAWGYVPAGCDHGLKRLVRATIAQAAADARKDDLIGEDARRWLLSEDCVTFCDFGGVNYTVVKEWVLGGCVDWKKPTTERIQ